MIKQTILPTLLVAVLLWCNAVHAQGIRKPSTLRADPEEFSNLKHSTKDSLRSISTQGEFDELARVFNAGTLYEIPHIMFLIALDEPDQPYFINSKKYRFHVNFARAMHLTLLPEQLFNLLNYSNEHRSFLLGTIAKQPQINRWTFEFWEGDRLALNQLELVNRSLKKTFFQPLAYKPNSLWQEQNCANYSGQKLLASDINFRQKYLGLNRASAFGRVRILDKFEDSSEISPSDIVVLNETPLWITPVRGLIYSKLSSPLAHVNLLARDWNIPNAYLENAVEKLANYAGKWVYLETKGDRYEIRIATDREIESALVIIQKTQTPPFDLQVAKPALLETLSAANSNAFGGKAANLGELKQHTREFIVPDGIAIPFAQYKTFVDKNGISNQIESLLADPEFANSAKLRKEKLAALRSSFLQGQIDSDLQDSIAALWKENLKSTPVFVRSSSNAEDLPNFNGAGLYDSVPNVTSIGAINDAIKVVWASLWNFEAFEARRAKQVDHLHTYMGVFIQVAIDMQSGGVMVTQDPFSLEKSDAVYIAASAGHNSTVTGDAKIVPEQILYTQKTGTFQRLTSSTQELQVVFDEHGGLKKVPVQINALSLSIPSLKKLVVTAREIQKIFPQTPQDIEWGLKDDKLYIFQTRTFKN